MPSSQIQLIEVDLQILVDAGFYLILKGVDVRTERRVKEMVHEYGLFHRIHDSIFTYPRLGIEA